MTATDLISRGKAAERELAQVQASFDRIKTSLLLKIAETELLEGALRESLYMQIKGLDQVRQELLRVRDAGQVEAWAGEQHG